MENNKNHNLGRVSFFKENENWVEFAHHGLGSLGSMKFKFFIYLVNVDGSRGIFTAEASADRSDTYTPLVEFVFQTSNISSVVVGAKITQYHEPSL